MRTFILLVAAMLWNVGDHVALTAAPITKLTLRGRVIDSLTVPPTALAGAMVQLVGDDSALALDHFSSISDSSGAFTIRDVSAGRYVIGFMHSALDTLGLEVADHVVALSSDTTVVLGLPSARTLMSVLCPDLRGSLLTGHVRDVRTDAALLGASVLVTWPDVESTPAGLSIVDRQEKVQTAAAGWFALCNLPSDADLSVRAAHGADSSGAIEVHIPETGFRHVTLAVGTAGNRHGRIIGQVFDQERRPLAGVKVELANSDTLVRESVTNAEGTFTLDHVLLGTQSVIARAIGYSPGTVIVHVGDRGATRTEIQLQRFVLLAGMTTRDSVAAAHVEEFRRDRISDGTRALYIEPAHLPGRDPQQSVCSLIAGMYPLPACQPPHRGGPVCEGFYLNGVANRTLDVLDIDPADVIGVAIVPGLSKYKEQLRGNRGLCEIAIWTRCPGFVIPTCKEDFAPSTRMHRPDDDPFALALGTRFSVLGSRHSVLEHPIIPEY